MSDGPRGQDALWARWRRPTLVRRLLLAQLAMLALLWSLAAGLLLIEALSQELYGAHAAYGAIFSIAENLVEQPERQRASLRAVDLALREAYGDRDNADMAPSILVWQAGRLIYKSDGVPESISNKQLDVIEHISAAGREWRASTQQSASSDVRVTLVMPSDAKQFVLSFNSRGYYILPLIISIPFLLFPAWLSIRLALRPWRHVSREIASRGPRHLTPLAFEPRHEELRPMVQSINALMQRLAESSVRERNFIADAAHELRTPIAAIRINVEVMRAQSTPASGHTELLDGMLRSSARATRLVSQLLRLMRSNTEGDVTPTTRLALDELLQERLAALSGLAQVRRVELELVVAQRGLEIIGDREGLMSMIDNLIENAIKYSPASGVVTVHLSCCANQAVFTVADQGPGIALALRSRVFDRFFRDPDQTQSGSGLGLAIVKSVIDNHGGKIAIDANPCNDRGLKVTVSLPQVVSKA